MAADVLYHVQRYERLLHGQANFRALWQELADFMMPRKSVVITPRPVGAKQTDRLFDSTPIHAAELLSATMQGSITSNAIPWFHLKMRDKALNDLKPVQDWLEQVEERMYLALRQSNFNAESHEVYLDIAVFGIGHLLVEEKDKALTDTRSTFGGLRFRAEAIGTYVIDESPEGIVDTSYTCLPMSAKAIAQKWTDCGEVISKAALAEPEKSFDILHVVCPRTSYDPAKKTAKQMAFQTLYIALPMRKLLEEGGVHEFNRMVPRWAKTSGEMYGRGPGMTALPDTRTLNRAVELSLEAGGSAIYPPVEVPDDGVFGDLNMCAGAVNVVDMAMAGRDGQVIRPIITGANFDVSQILTNDLRARIQHVFFWEQLQMQGDHQMTATEVEKKWELMRRVLGPTLGRLESEFLNPLIDRIFGLMLRAGALPAPPQELSGANMDVEYEGPLARSQKVQRLEGFQQWWTLVFPMIQANPAMAPKVFAVLDLEPLLRDLASIAGMSTAWMVSGEKYQQAMQALDESQHQQEQLAQAQQIAEMVKNAGPTVTGAIQNGQTNGQGQMTRAA